MPKKEKWYFKYIYVNRRHPDLLENLKGGHYWGIHFISADDFNQMTGDRRRYDEYILRGFPPNNDPNDVKELFGDKQHHIHKVIRMNFKGKASSSVKIIWKSNSEEPPKEMPLYMDLEKPPIVQVEKMRPPKCFKCNKPGHLRKNCLMKTDDTDDNEEQVTLDNSTDESSVRNLQTPHHAMTSVKTSHQLHQGTYAQVANPNKTDGLSRETSPDQNIRGKVDSIVEMLFGISDEDLNKSKQIEKLQSELALARQEKEKAIKEKEEIMKRMSEVENQLKILQAEKANDSHSFSSDISSDIEIEEQAENYYDVRESEEELEDNKEEEEEHSEHTTTTDKGKKENIDEADTTEASAVEKKGQIRISDTNMSLMAEEQVDINKTEEGTSEHISVTYKGKKESIEGKDKIEEASVVKKKGHVDGKVDTDSVANSPDFDSPQLPKRTRSNFK